MTVEEATEAALARLSQFGQNWPQTRSVMYRRLGVRQQELFALAAEINPDYFGTSVTIPITNGRADFKAAIAPQGAAMISRIQTSPGATEVHTVRLTDPDASLPPRVTIRDGILEQVGTDLATTTALTIFYSRLPSAIGPSDGNRQLELPEPFQELLVVDLALYLIQQTAPTDPSVQAAIPLLQTEEKALIEGYAQHIRHFSAAAEKGRFGRSSTTTYQ